MKDEDFLVPSVILWNLYLIYLQIVPPGSIKCIRCGQFMSEGYWIDGSSEGNQPRVLHGIEKVVLLYIVAKTGIQLEHMMKSFSRCFLHRL